MIIACTNAQVNNQEPSDTQTNSVLILGNFAYQDMKYAVAADYYENYLKVSSDKSTDVLNNLANCYWQMRDYDNALRVYNVLYPAVSNGVDAKTALRIGELFARNGKYLMAYEWLKKVPGYEEKATGYMQAETMNTMKSDSLLWNVGFLNCNSPYRDFTPIVYKNLLLFSSNKPLGVSKQAYGWDGGGMINLWRIPAAKSKSISLSAMNDSNYYKKTPVLKKRELANIYECGDSKPQNNIMTILMNKPTLAGGIKGGGNLVGGFNDTLNNANAQCIDKYNHIYFSANYAKPGIDGVNRISILEGVYGNDVKNIKRLPLGNLDNFSVMHPAVNNDGTLLICSSDKSGGRGGMDLFYSQRKNVKSEWEPLKELTGDINTLGNEVFPSVTSDGFLYFSSDAHAGLGGLDIYKISIKDALNGTGEIEHISYPINSSADDFGWAQKDSTGTSGYFTSDRQKCNDDIYSFTYAPIKESKKINIGFLWKLSNVHYDFDKSDLRTDAKPMLDSLIRISKDHYITIDSLVLILNENPITIEVGSHTDSRGSYEYNMKLALRRAESVKAYLVQHGVKPERITTQSYGKAKLLRKEEKSDEDFQVNRRSEIKVTGYTVKPKE